MVTKTTQLELDLDLAKSVREYHRAHIHRCTEQIMLQTQLKAHHETALANINIEIGTLEQQIIDLTPEH